MSGVQLIQLAEVASTNTWLKQHRRELSNGAAVTALRQTAGRGRMGHEWKSSDGMLPLSVLLRNIPYPQQVTLAVCMAVCDVLERLTGEKMGIKWPNDIILREHKLCGILCESVTDCDSTDIICGVGLNISQSADFFTACEIPHGGSLRSLLGIDADRTRLASDIAESILRYSHMDISGYLDEYRARSITVGREVRIITVLGETIAFAEDITNGGQLLCRSGNKRFEVNSGEVSVRGLLGYV